MRISDWSSDVCPSDLLYGLMFKPTNFDPTKQYPIVNYIYPGPQTGSVRSRSFLASHGDNQALAELGFIVVAIDGMGPPWRSQAFHEIGRASCRERVCQYV